MWIPLYVFIGFMVLFLVLLPVEAHYLGRVNRARPRWENARRLSKIHEFVSLLQGLTLCGVIISFVLLLSIVFWNGIIFG